MLSFLKAFFFFNLTKLRDKGISNSLFDTSVGIYIQCCFSFYRMLNILLF